MSSLWRYLGTSQCYALLLAHNLPVLLVLSLSNICFRVTCHIQCHQLSCFQSSSSSFIFVQLMIPAPYLTMETALELMAKMPLSALEPVSVVSRIQIEVGRDYHTGIFHAWFSHFQVSGNLQSVMCSTASLMCRSNINCYSKHLHTLLYPTMWNHIIGFTIVNPCNGQWC